MGNTYVKGIELNADLDPVSWFNIHLFTRVRAQHTVSAFYTGAMDTRGTDFFMRPILTIKPGKDWINDSRNFVLLFFYRFGKAISGQRKHDANGAQSEQNRAN